MDLLCNFVLLVMILFLQVIMMIPPTVALKSNFVRSLSSSYWNLWMEQNPTEATAVATLEELNERKAGLIFVCSSNRREFPSSLSDVREAVDAVESLGKQVTYSNFWIPSWYQFAIIKVMDNGFSFVWGLNRCI
jgi:aspartyl-tRNA synthetase